MATYINDGNPIYITYARNDKSHSGWEHISDVIEIIKDRFQEERIHYFIDTEDIEAGDKISDFEKKIGESDYTILVYCDKYFHSMHCMYELAAIMKNMDKKKGVIYINADNVDLTDLYISELERFWLYKESDMKLIKRHNTRELTDIEIAAEDNNYYIDNILSLKTFFSDKNRLYAYNMEHINKLIKKVKKWFINTSPVLENIQPYSIDMGLSVLWADRNIGAERPWDTGNYFAWGETGPKKSYSWKNYEYCKDGDFRKITKYCVDLYYGQVDNKIYLESDDDAAVANLKNGWIIPSVKQWQEICNKDYCDWKWTKEHGINGYRVISRVNGNSIFLPTVGFFTFERKYLSSRGYYWSSSLLTEDPYLARHLRFDAYDARTFAYGRYYGFPIRPVCPQK